MAMTYEKTDSIEYRNEIIGRNAYWKMAHGAYIEYVNDFLTLERFAESCALPIETAREIVELGRKLDRGEFPLF